MEPGIFKDRSTKPGADSLEAALAASYKLWQTLVAYVIALHPQAREEWNYSKLGWSCRVKDNKRVVIYLMPYDGWFRFSIVLGRAAVQQALASAIDEGIKQNIASAPVYAEGTGIRIEVKRKALLKSLQTLIDIKLAN